MSLRSAVRRVARLAGVVGGVGLVAVAAAQQPVNEKSPAKPAPALRIPTADDPAPEVPVPVAKVEVGVAPINGDESLPKALAEARGAYGKTRDYACYLVRQEKVGGKLLPEEVTELRVKTQPFSAAVRVITPKALAGQDTIYQTKQSTLKVRFRAAGPEGFRGYASLPLGDAKVMADTRHPMPDVGLLAVVERIEHVIATEKKLNHPVQVLASDYTFNDRSVVRYEVFTDLPHQGRYAFRCVLCVDKETKLPIRFEAYEQPKAGGPIDGELLEVQSFIGLKLNANIEASVFDR
ncbi:DUF1571 domain-containing protein [Fimbriiglobus ruber]|uniref:Outer membrane lipoprotein-sorting protein n=1 Tax=Fimbriiglobus ruber TaxID=1908690 RepID=A0A225E099_9BACT|nr:DUF1571 domain-containing protein [Fimbriiglobus ruber]OWK41787.1 hypothetical protein FRUB_03865 [Fimbriiglobus ruber]